MSGLLDPRFATARVVNGIMAATYYELGRRIVEFEQGGQIRSSYLGWEIVQTPSGLFQIRARLDEPTSGQAGKMLSVIPSPLLTTETFPLPWSHYVRLMTVANRTARQFYEEEAIKGGWSVRQLDRQISTQFFERLSGSKRKGELLAKPQVAQPGDIAEPSELVRAPYVLELLNLTDEYGESYLEEAIIRNLESFLVELGCGFTFVARQLEDSNRRAVVQNRPAPLPPPASVPGRHRLIIGAFSHADAGQMNLYLNYAKEHLTEPGEHDPVGLILCSEISDTVVKYAMGGISAKVFASEYLTVLPSEEELRTAIERAMRALVPPRTKTE